MCRQAPGECSSGLEAGSARTGYLFPTRREKRSDNETSECTYLQGWNEVVVGWWHVSALSDWSWSDQTPGSDENEKLDGRLFDWTKTLIGP